MLPLSWDGETNAEAKREAATLPQLIFQLAELLHRLILASWVRQLQLGVGHDSPCNWDDWLGVWEGLT